MPLRDPSYAVSVLEVLSATASTELQREARETALKESEERYRYMFKNNHAVMLVIDPENYNIVDGEYAIAIAAQGESDVFLTNNDQWGSSDLIDQNQDSYRLGLDCYNGTLSLYVDGQLIDTVDDDTYISGSSGLIIWSGEDVSSADVSFDDFIVESIE